MWGLNFYLNQKCLLCCVVKAKLSKYQMLNDQMPNYTVQTQYVSIMSTL